MTGFLKRLFGPASEPVAKVEHPDVGTLLYDREAENWSKRVMVSGHEFRLSVGGAHEPHPLLLQRAADLQAELPAVLSTLPAFLERHAQELPELSTEIRSLTVAEVAVWWPKQPNAVMIWFNGPSEQRLWHCDYAAGDLTGLVYDP